jgi:hypothetical protein
VQDISGLRHDGGKLHEVFFISIKKGENASLLIKGEVIAPIKETIKHKSVLIDIPATGFLDIMHIAVSDLKAVHKVIKTKLDITPPIKPKPLSSYYQEVVVVNGL